MELRPYQKEAVDAVFKYWGKGGENVLVSMATGTGKSLVIAALVRELLAGYPDMRVLMLVHVRELVEQNAKAMLKAWPGAPLGINSAGLRRRDHNTPILFGSIQSVFRSAKAIAPRDLVIVDECHLLPRAGDGMYRTLLDDLRNEVPDMRVAGFTATPYRLDSGRLDSGKDALFSRIVYDYGIGRGIKGGWLSPLISKATATALDVSGVAKRGGEFVQGALEAAVDQDAITKAAVDELVAYGAGRRSWLVFATGVAHALHLRDEIQSRGVSCETVSGETSPGDRDRIIGDFRSGQLRCLTNCMVLTTGFDAPMVDLLAMLRPTLSAGLYVQQVGRGTRIADGKKDCLVLDFAGNMRRHGPVDTIGGSVHVKASGDGEAEVKAKACPDCKTLVAVSTVTCPVCDYQWPRNDKPKHEAKADADTPILSTGKPQWIKVRSIDYHKHNKFGNPDAPPTMKVEFYCGVSIYRDFVCFEHTGFPRSKAEKWWRSMRGQQPVPATVSEALLRAGKGELTTPAEILVQPDGKWFRIVAKRFENVPSELIEFWKDKMGKEKMEAAE